MWRRGCTIRDTTGWRAKLKSCSNLTYKLFGGVLPTMPILGMNRILLHGVEDPVLQPCIQFMVNLKQGAKLKNDNKLSFSKWTLEMLLR